MRRITTLILATALAVSFASCSFEDARTAKNAQQQLVGWSEPDLETCLGAPDQHGTFGNTEILTYYASSTSNRSLGLGMPIFGGFNLGGGGGGYCHAIFRMKDGHLAEVRYSGETDATMAPDAYCAPIVRGCVEHPEHLDVPHSNS